MRIASRARSREYVLPELRTRIEPGRGGTHDLQVPRPCDLARDRLRGLVGGLMAAGKQQRARRTRKRVASTSQSARRSSGTWFSSRLSALTT